MTHIFFRPIIVRRIIAKHLCPSAHKSSALAERYGTAAARRAARRVRGIALRADEGIIINRNRGLARRETSRVNQRRRNRRASAATATANRC